ncbi:N-acyl-D-amino-acid deacylase family protein [Cloacibacillus evryensis]|uniref:Amidohydrolase family protein n=1 Tax=Cloacibacillus evryensis TaxID=508460 RepID=A0AAW5JZG4_9BACT|nr:amidohydrolase family protein [Cloacibacillus evryensis]MCQ4813122.1 amidohydrolase family protein [Cloacibacillus evryensis]
MFDILIKNAYIYDGSGNSPYLSNIMIRDGVIAKIGNADDEAFYEIDASGHVVSPGFIDPHTHYDNTVLYDKQMVAPLCQGVTTVITGLCGLGTVPLQQEYRSEVNRLNSGMVGYRDNFNYTAANIEDYLYQADGAAVNVAAAIGHIPLRISAGGFNCVGYAGLSEKMKGLLRENLRMGAVGFSIGLDYFPTHSSVISSDELTDLNKVVAEENAVFLAHVRPSSVDGSMMEGNEEVCSIAESLGVRTHVLHTRTLYPVTCGKPEVIAEVFEKSISNGADISVESYPYFGGQTYGIYYLPAWAQEGTSEEIIRRLKDLEVRSAITDNCETLVYYKPARFAYVKYHPEYEGHSLDYVAKIRGQKIGDMLAEVLIESDLGVSITSADGIAGANINSQLLDDFMFLLQKPYYTVGSDSMDCGSHTHPRAFGSYAKVLRLTREYGYSLEKLIYKLTKFNADRFGLVKRGVLSEGNFADITIFKYTDVYDKATYAMPMAPPEGIKCVIVNGQIALYDGCPTGTLPGRSLKRNKI